MNPKYKQRTFWFAILLEAVWAALCFYNHIDPLIWLEKAMYIGAAWGVLDKVDKFVTGKNGGD